MYNIMHWLVEREAAVLECADTEEVELVFAHPQLVDRLVPAEQARALPDGVAGHHVLRQGDKVDRQGQRRISRGQGRDEPE